MRWIFIPLAVLLLAGCGNDPANPSNDPSGYFNTTVVDVDGRKVPCITWKDGYGGGLSCDWSPT